MGNQNTKQRNCEPASDTVNEVIRDKKSPVPQWSERELRKKVIGYRCTKSSVEHRILDHPEDAELPAKTIALSGSGGRWKVSGKIGARPGRKDKVTALSGSCWSPTDISA